VRLTKDLCQVYKTLKKLYEFSTVWADWAGYQQLLRAFFYEFWGKKCFKKGMPSFKSLPLTKDISNLAFLFLKIL
jgi:hypothetical protein